MRIILDKESDASYFRLDESRIVDSEEIKPGGIVDYDANDRAVGVEFLNISSRASREQLSSINFNLHEPQQFTTETRRAQREMFQIHRGEGLIGSIGLIG
jgi:uncharacterized protein YuzE